MQALTMNHNKICIHNDTQRNVSMKHAATIFLLNLYPKLFGTFLDNTTDDKRNRLRRNMTYLSTFTYINRFSPFKWKFYTGTSLHAGASHESYRLFTILNINELQKCCYYLSNLLVQFTILSSQSRATWQQTR